jgi:hypothetical protein
MASLSLPAVSTAFSVAFTYPADGAYIASRLVSANGTCAGPAIVQWNTSRAGGFLNGTRENLTFTESGGLTLRTVLKDDFPGPALDPSKWTSMPKAELTTYQPASTVSIRGGPSPGPNDNCMIRTVADRKFNPTTASRTFTCRATFNSGNDWMGILLIEADDGSFAGITWGVGADQGGEDNVVCLLTWVGASHPFLKGPTLVPGQFYEFKLAVAPPGTVTGYYRAGSADAWSQIASAAYNYNAQHSLLLGRTLDMGGGGDGYSGMMTADWVRDEGTGGFFDDFDGPELDGSLWTSNPEVSLSGGGAPVSVVDISGGPSPGVDEYCRIDSKAPYVFNPMLESRNFTSRATHPSGNDWMGMVLIHADDGRYAGITWGAGEDYGGQDNVVCLLTWTGNTHPFLKGATLTPGGFFEFRLACVPGTVSGYWRATPADAWTPIGSAAYSVDASHSVLFGRSTVMGGGGPAYSGRMLLDWVREEGESALRGEYVSPVRDTNCTSPEYLGLSWDADAPPGASVELFFRSSADADMTGASAWTPVAWGQPVPGPCQRYAQFKAVLRRDGPLLFPVLNSVSLRYTGIQGVRITTDGSHWTDAGGTSAWEAAIGLVEGNNTITAEAVDCSGDRQRAEVRVIVDTSQFDLRIDSPAAGQRLRGLSVPVAISASVRGPVGVTSVFASADGVNWTACRGGKAWTANLTFPGYGNRTVYAKAVNAAGNVQTARADIVLETAPPVISILKPLEGEKLSGRKVAVNAQVQAAEKAAITSVEASPDGVAWTPCSPGAVWAADITFKSTGRRTVYVRAFDDTGNSATAELNVTLKAPASTSTPGMELPIAGAALAAAAVLSAMRRRPRR